MSEYQYYEFQAVDRPLSAADRQTLRAISTRARITATSFTNSYEWGDLKGDPADFMKRWFDLHLYLTNWGTRRLMIRLPKRLVDQRFLKPLLLGIDWATLQAAGDTLILDIARDEVELDEDWDDGSGWLAALAPLRAELLAGDLQLFYLLWLGAVESDELGDDEIEPMAGIGTLTGALGAFVEFFGIDPDLVEAAVDRPVTATATSPDAAVNVIAAMTDHEKRICSPVCLAAIRTSPLSYALWFKSGWVCTMPAYPPEHGLRANCGPAPAPSVLPAIT